MYILGISAFYHDSAACLIKDGNILAAAQEERFTRIKHDSSFPINSIKFCLTYAGISIDQVNYIGFYEKPHLKFERILKTYANFFPKGFDTFQDALYIWIKEKLWIPNLIRSQLLDISPSRGNEMLWDQRIIFSEHHQSHAASAFYPSPFKEAAILTVDGVGEWATTTFATGYQDSRGVPKMKFLKEIRYPHSLGMLYSSFTYFLGFKVNSGEYKVMGLAPYGDPKYVDVIIKNLITIMADGSYRLNMDYFSFPYDYIMINKKFCKLFQLSPRKTDEKLTQKHFDIAASIQKVTEITMENMVNYIFLQTGMKNICLAGGVALNCVVNGLILKKGPFQDIWIQPAAGDAGGAVGVALYIWHDVLGERKNRLKTRDQDLMQGCYLGPEYSNPEILKILNRRKIPYRELSDDTIPDVVSDLLMQEFVVGWFQGRMEFGPRALGNRSILGDPRSIKMQKTMNLKIKYRESFRPFAPSVIRECVYEWFDLCGKQGSCLASPDGGYNSPYMILVAPVKKSRCIEISEEQKKQFGLDKLNTTRSIIPACTHVDYSARIQTVNKETNPRFYNLLKKFEDKTGVPVLLNTSFNVRGEPIVCSPDDAINCFLGTEMDALVLGSYLILKQNIPKAMKIDYKKRFDPD